MPDRTTMRRWIFVVCAASLSGGPAYGLAQTASPDAAPRAAAEKTDDRSTVEKLADVVPHVAGPTLGGTQLWTDEQIVRDWRIQRNAVTGHCRLLDENNFRLAWGDFDACRLRLEELRRKRRIEPVGERVVVLLHGLGATRHSMSGLARHLEEQGGYTAINMTYASTRDDLASHARSLAKVIAGLPEAKRIDLVAHSLGNLVIRQYLTDPQNPGRAAAIDPRIGRLVMLGPPNNGAQWGAVFKGLPLFESTLGKSAVQVSADGAELARRLAIPPCDFAILAGGQSNGRGLNPLIAGDDDAIVSVEETRLSGARDFLVVPVLHRWLMDDRMVRQYVLSFLRNGHFVAADLRVPLP